MSNYTKATNFTAKDGLPAGNSSKVVKGVELDTEFTAIVAAVASKADSNSPTFTGTPLAPTAAGGTNNTQIATTAFATAVAAAAFPVGGIILWSGSVASIPSGWALCNGSNGTPDLRDRFVVGAGNTYAVNATGGSANAIVVSHTHTASSSTVSDHQHALFANADTGTSALTTLNEANYKQQGGNSLLEYFIRGSSTAATLGLSSAAGSHTHSITVDTQGSSGTNANLPPYYALAYIMKL
jgi:microcystin-dependent protein